MLSNEFASVWDVTPSELQAADWLTWMYGNFLGRDADAAGFDYWLSAMSNGSSLAEVIGGFLVAEEMQAYWLPQSDWDFIL